MKKRMVGVSLFMVVALWWIRAAPVEAKALPVHAGQQLVVGTGSLSALPGVVDQSGWVLDRAELVRPQPPEWRRSARRGRLRVARRGRRRSRRAGRLVAQDEAPQQENGAAAREQRVERRAGAAGVGVERRTVAQRAVDPALTSKEWVMRELAGVQLRDARLERRLCQLVEQMAAQPTASIPQACGSAAATKAAYRFFSNDKVKRQAILESHEAACRQRVAAEELVLVLQDTTTLDYSHHPHTEGLGPLEKEDRLGLLVHSSMAVSGTGVPLGLLDQQVWRRDPAAVGQRHQRKKRATEDKESAKWLRGLRASLPDAPEQMVLVNVADREADIFDFFLEADKHQADVLVRASWNRCVSEPGGHLFDEVANSAVRGSFSVEVGRTKDRLPRQATVEVRFVPVTIRPPRRRKSEAGLHPLPIYAIQVSEETPPNGEKPLHWLLLTNRRVESFEEARQYVRWYGLRWLVERYHFVLKSGCRIEHRQLETGARLERCLGVYTIVAWRMLWLTYQARITPEAPCSVALETPEWQALYCYTHHTTIPPDEPPSLHEAIRWIAQLGGFLGRKGDGEPGVRVLWRGLQRLRDIADTYQLFHPPSHVGNA